MNSVFKMCSKRNANKPFTVIVEGNIGSGKTTFLNYFKDIPNVMVLAEPVNKWRDCNGHNLLERMYADTKTWSFAFQSYVQLTMLENHTVATEAPIKLMERSIYSARNCFVEQMARTRTIDGGGVAVIDEWFKWIHNNCDISVDLIVYLKTSPEVAYERTKKRNRPEEQCVPFEYIQQIHDIHEDWLFHKTLHHCPAPVVILDANLDETVILEEYQKLQVEILSHRALATVA